MLPGKVLKRRDTLIEQSPWYEILQQSGHTNLNASNSAINMINAQQNKLFFSKILRKIGKK